MWCGGVAGRRDPRRGHPVRAGSVAGDRTNRARAGLGDLLRAMLARDPADRPSAADVYRAPRDVRTAGARRPPPDLRGDRARRSRRCRLPPLPDGRWPTRPRRRNDLRCVGAVGTPEPDADEPEPVASADQAPARRRRPPDGSMHPIGPSWSLPAEGAPGDDGQPAAAGGGSLPSSARSIDRVRRPLDRRHAHRQPERLRRTVTTCLVALALAAGSVLAGLWWASSDATAGAVLPAVTPASSTEDSSTATAVAERLIRIDWPAVVTDLDRRRSAAFAAAMRRCWPRVYAPGSSAMAVDVDRINQLVACRCAGRRSAARDHVGPVARSGHTADRGGRLDARAADPGRERRRRRAHGRTGWSPPG